LVVSRMRPLAWGRILINKDHAFAFGPVFERLAFDVISKVIVFENVAGEPFTLIFLRLSLLSGQVQSSLHAYLLRLVISHDRT
jgi:hypothetical protein